MDMDPWSLTSQCSSLSSSTQLNEDDVCFASSLDSLGPTHIISRSRTPSGSEKITSTSVIEAAWEQLGITPHMTFEQLISEPASPRITLSLLRSLEITAIANSPELRFDLNHTKKLRYKKVEVYEDDEEDIVQHNGYRQALTLEIRTYSKLYLIFPLKRRHQVEFIIGRRLRKLLATIKAIIKTLTPTKHLYGIERIWDVELILQEISSGCHTFASHAKSLSTFLLRFSSPSREQRLEQLPKYFETQNLDDIISGLFEILDVLELLKLDSANYLLRHYSPHLINATTSFGLKHFGNKILDHKLDPTGPRQWFLGQVRDLSSEKLGSLKQLCKDPKLVGFINGILRSIVFRLELPETFEYDRRRIHSHSKEFNTVLELRICYLVFTKKLQDQPKHIKVKIPRRAEVMENISLLVLEKGSVTSALSNIAVYFANLLSSRPDRKNHSLSSELIEEFTILLLGGLNCTELRAGRELAIYSALFLKVCRYCDQLYNAPLWEVYNRLSETRAWPRLSKSAFHLVPLLEEEMEIDNLSKRIASMSLINWRIFAPLIYLNNDLVEPDKTSVAKLPTFPVASLTGQKPILEEGNSITESPETGTNLEKVDSKDHGTTEQGATDILASVCCPNNLPPGRPRGATTGSSTGNNYEESL
jgi:hypothetical protein